MKKIILLLPLVTCFSIASADDLDNYRQQINQLDQELVKVIADREQLSLKVGEYKKARNMPVYAPEREAKLKEKHTQMAEEAGVSPDLINNIFEQIMANSRALQK